MDKKKSFIIFFSLLLASFVFFLSGTISNAAPSQTDIDTMTSDLNQRFGISPNQNLISDICDFWDNNHDTYPYLLLRYFSYGSGYVGTSLFMKNNPTVTGGNTYNIKSDCRCPVVLNNALDVNPLAYENFYSRNSLSLQNNTYYSVTCATSQAILYSYDDFHTDDIDWDNPIYAVNIPVPVLDVTYVPAISMLGGLPQTNNVFTDINVEDNAAFKIQLAVKVTVADMVQIGLTNGTTTYKYLDWTEGTLSDIYSLEDLHDAENISISNSDLATVWDNLYNSLYDDSDFPVFSSSVPFWNSNPNAQKYLDAQSYYRNNMARQMPMYGTRLEVFARYFAIDGQDVYVGAWRHWNSAEPLNTEKVTDKYQDQQPFPGTENTNTNVDYDTSDDTYTTIGTQTGVYTDPYTQVVINQNVPNYPDYPTAVSYNHDNILLQFIETANQLPNFFGQFGAFLTATFSFIDRSVWAIIGFGFMCSIVIMIIKVL